MKLLFDQNLSQWLCRAVADVFPGARHFRDIGFREARDTTIWDYAAQYGFAIVTKDADFRQRSFLEGLPPKVIWVRLGNCSSQDIEDLLARARDITEFLADEEKSFFALS